MKNKQWALDMGYEFHETGFYHHGKEICDGPPCVFHGPSDHNMKDWPVILRGSGLIERECGHGIGHPDPDSVAWMHENTSYVYLGTHGCDGCCAK